MIRHDSALLGATCFVGSVVARWVLTQSVVGRVCLDEWVWWVTLVGSVSLMCEIGWMSRNWFYVGISTWSSKISRNYNFGMFFCWKSLKTCRNAKKKNSNIFSKWPPYWTLDQVQNLMAWSLDQAVQGPWSLDQKPAHEDQILSEALLHAGVQRP